MKGGKTPLGYTIVEVMIVLAISTAMFAMAARFIGGKQAKTAFNEGANNMASKVQAVIDQVSDGQYSDIYVNCTGGGGSINIAGGGSGQGVNSPCVFLGKALHFATNRNTFDVISIASSRINALNAPPVSPADGGAKAINALTTEQRIPQNLSVTRARVQVGATTYVRYSIGFLQQAGFIGQPARGAQSIGLYYVTTSSSSLLSTTTAQNQVIGSSLAPSDFAKICISDGTRYAQIMIGTSDGTNPNYNPTTVKLVMNGTVSCT